MSKKDSFPPDSNPLFRDIRQLIEESRQGVAVAVNAAISTLYWQVGRRINEEILQNERTGYGEQIVKTLACQLAAEYGKRWSEKQLRHSLRFVETMPEFEIVSALRRQLSWTHIKSLIYIDDPLKRTFTLCI